MVLHSLVLLGEDQTPRERDPVSDQHSGGQALKPLTVFVDASRFCF